MRGKLRGVAFGVGCTLLLSMAQVWQLRRSVPRLPIASGDAFGSVGEGAGRLRLLIVGDSSSVGVGVTRFDESLAACIARQYSRLAGCAVDWFVYGKSGATLESLCELLAAQPPGALEADVVVVAIGVNDVLRFRSHSRWSRTLLRLLRDLQWAANCRQILVSPLPPLWKFRVLPVALRLLAGAHALTLDWITRRCVHGRPGIRHLRIPLPDPATMLAGDGFHPSRTGYEEWASHVARALHEASAVAQYSSRR
jgi:lysophospholipase L1-like esterase